MARKMLVACEIRWRYVLLQLAVLIALVAVCQILLGNPVAGYWGFVIFTAYWLGSRAILARHQNAGVRQYRQRQWAEALSYFQRSQAFFEQYPWIDRYRQVLLISTSGVSYHEMALINQGRCLIYMNRGPEARRIYERVLELYPDSPFAEGVLKTMDAGVAASQSA